MSLSTKEHPFVLGVLGGRPGHTRGMSNTREPLPEEKAVDAEPATDLILEESEERALRPVADEHRTSDEATPPA